ncbi:MAG: phosphotransferase [Proteobacteria bacterium]|nr:phosphotransferase [Pseudomonadota bacterium]
MRLSDQNLPTYLAAHGLLTQPGAARVELAGDGNINFVRRVRAADGSTLIVKQARDALERFPEYRVTTERIVFENRYLQQAALAAPEHASLLPAVHHFDEEERVLVLEDLGTRRMDELGSAGDAGEVLATLGGFLGAVHEGTRSISTRLKAEFGNEEMRRLHGEHIFTLPYELGAFPLSDAVHRAAADVLGRPGVLSEIDALRDHYYGDADALVHADAQPGNVMLAAGGPRLIDAEIAHVGDPAFDLGIVLAHVEVAALASHDAAPWTRAAARLLEGYLRGGGRADDVERAHRHAGVELLRRTIGAARLARLEPDALSEAALWRGAELLLGRS